VSGNSGGGFGPCPSTMRRLESQSDGRRLAVAVLRQLREGGPERCRANLPPPRTIQADALILALVDLKERGTVDALAGFGAILTDALGTRCLEPTPELYEQIERSSGFRHYKLKRLVNAGHRLAIPALRREAGQ
jgi:hypothetical protein